MNQRFWRAMQAGCLVAALAACGGGGSSGDGSEPSAVLSAVPGVAIIGVAGGTVLSDEGAQIVFPKNALRGDVTVRIAKDSTGAPPLPAAAAAAGAVYAITPHGGAFDDFVEVSIPVDHPEQAGSGQLLLVTAEPGDTQWRVLSGASYHDGKMRAPVLHFSFFQTIRLVDQVMPQLVTKIDGANNVGGAGIPLLPPLQNIPFLKTDPYSNCLGGCPIPVNTLVAELSLPAARLAAVQLGVTPPTACRPVDLGHGAMSFRFRREGSQEFFPTVDHPAVMPRDPWPRFPGDGGAVTFAHTTTNGRGTFPGFGAIHYYGNETPRIYGMYDANPPTQAQLDRYQLENNRNQTYPPPYQLPIGNVYALPPVGDNPADNLYTWNGSVWWLATQNGSIRIDTAIMTTCGLLLEAVPLTFKLNAPPPRGYVTTEFFSLNSEQANGVAEGTDVTLQFARYDHAQHRWTGYDADITSYRIDFSPDPTTVDWQPAPASAVTRSHFQFFDWGTSSDVDAAGVQLSLPAVQASQTGSYRVFYCEATGCFASDAYRLIVLRAPPTITAQPAGQTVQAGESASFTVATSGAPLPTIQWQKRSLLAAAFGFLAWTNIDGATSATYTTPALTMADTGTQYRAWANNALGGVVSDLAMLTVIERFLPPVIDAQPGNLNVVVGGTAVFAATVSGTGPLSFQWRRNGTNITGANSTILTLSNVSQINAGRYELVATNSAGSVTTEPGLLLVTLDTPVALAPAIAAPPASITVAEGNTANFAVAVTGTAPYSYQWFKAGVPIAGSNAASFSIPAVTLSDAGAYSVRVTNNVGQVLSAAATLTVTAGGGGATVAPTIVTAPIALAVLPGGGATFAVAATGTAPLSYQWRRNGVDIAGAIGAVLHFAAANALDAGQYAVEVRNTAGAASSGGVPLIVIGAPVITQQPVAVSATAGQTAVLSVAASGDGLLYQWTRNQVAIAGATAASYTTPALALADNGAVYGVLVYNGAGLVFSQDAVLTVTAAPPVVAAWQAAALLETNNIGDATRARIALNASGNGIAVWQQAHDNVLVSIWASHYTAGSGWGAPVLIEADDTGDSLAPQVAVDSDGNALALWEGPGGTVWANRYAAASNTWGTPVALGSGTGSGHKIAFDSAGNAMAVWHQFAGGTVNVWADRYVAGTGWAAAQAIFDVGNSGGVPDIAFDAGGNALLVAMHWNGVRTNIYAKRYRVATQTWDAPVLIETDDSGAAAYPKVAIDANGNALAVWTHFDGTRYDIRASRYTAATDSWTTAPLSLTAAAGSGDAPQVAFDASGNGIAIWAQGTSDYHVWSNRYTAGVGWGTAVQIETNTGNAGLPQVAVDPAGHAFAVWYQFNGSFYDVWVNRYTLGAGWGTPALLETLAGQALRPQVAIDANGKAVAVWDQFDGTRISVWASEYR